MQKILLLTDVPPCKNYSGAMLTCDMISQLPKGSVECYVVLNPELDFLKDSNTLCDVPMTFTKKPRERAVLLSFSRLKILFYILNYLRELYTEMITVRKIEKEIIEFAEGKKFIKVWCILQGQTMIRLASNLLNKLKFPLHVQVWDHPEWWLKANNADPLTKKKVVLLYNHLIKECKVLGTASYEMSRMYNKIQPNNIPLVASLNAGVIQFGYEGKNNDSVIRIGVAGQLYANQEWNGLLDALDLMNWKANNKTVFVRYIGYCVLSTGHRKVNIEFLGYRSQKETIQLLSECDILYCPYFFDKQYDIIARTSFPSKLTTYLAAGKPVLFHGPSYASPAIFLKDNNAALICDTLDASEVAAILRRLLVNQEQHDAMVINGHKAFMNHLTLDKLKNATNYFLQIGNEGI